MPNSYRVVFNTIPPGVPDQRDVIAYNPKHAISLVAAMFPVRLKIIRVIRLDPYRE